MKSALVILTLSLTLNVLAATNDRPFAMKLEAVNTINDAQEAMQTGKVSDFLSQKMREVKTSNRELSDSQALELLVTDAVKILN